jgi:hypothetical protein
MKISEAKLKSLSRILKVFFDILFWASVASVAISSLFFIVTFFIHESVFILPKAWEGHTSITVGIMKFNIDPNLYDNINLKHLLQTMLPMIIVLSSIFMIVNHNFRLILKTVADNRPFERNNAKRLFIIGIVLIISSVVLKFIEARFAFAIIDMLKIENIDVNFTIDGAMLLTGFLILILAGVFQYGSYLQEEYDTTL